MQKYMIKSKLQMPVILHNDIIAKWLGLKQGDIVKILRYNENSGLSYYYRCCI
jgi:DNA-directed RNA polymerase subunit H (RpoH/RPB5)